jgi:hypothetical protein
MEAFHLGAYLSPVSNAFVHTPVTIPYVNYVTTPGDLIMVFTCISGTIYNVTNIYAGYEGA